MPTRGNWLAWLLLCFVASCAQPPVTPSTEAIVLPRAVPGPAAPEVTGPKEQPSEAAFFDMVAEVKDLTSRHDYTRALEAIDKALAQDPPWTVGRQLEGLRVEVKQHLLQSMLVEGMIVLDSDQVALGDPITGKLMVVNLSVQPVFIPATRRHGGSGANSQSTIHVDVSIRELGHEGSIVQDRVTWNMGLKEDLNLAPGERSSWPLNLETIHFNPGRPTYRRYEIRAMFYPAAIEVGGEEFPGNLSFRGRECRVFPRNFEHLTDRPMERLRQAVGHVAAAHYIPLIAGLMPDAERDTAVDYLLDIVRRPEDEILSGETRVACCVGLGILTGDDRPSKPDAWRDYSRGN